MKVCDTCKRSIPPNDRDTIEVKFWGKHGELIKRLHGTNFLDFCSLACFDKFQLPTVEAEGASP